MHGKEAHWYAAHRSGTHPARPAKTFPCTRVRMGQGPITTHAELPAPQASEHTQQAAVGSLGSVRCVTTASCLLHRLLQRARHHWVTAGHDVHTCTGASGYQPGCIPSGLSKVVRALPPRLHACTIWGQASTLLSRPVARPQQPCPAGSPATACPPARAPHASPGWMRSTSQRNN
jgi:hypothetical protein